MSSLLPSAVTAWFVSDLVGNPEDRFCRTRLNLISYTRCVAGSGIELLRNMKEKTACVAEDPQTEDDNMLDSVSYNLPDGTLLEVGDERFRCAESLFQPQLTGNQHIDKATHYVNIFVEKY